jgi:hypothetical protein
VRKREVEKRRRDTETMGPRLRGDDTVFCVIEIIQRSRVSTEQAGNWRLMTDD